MERASVTTADSTRSASIQGSAPPPNRHEELAEFLRSNREATSPESVGLEGGGRRRTPGLRREEVAQLAGVGLSWYTWLEQGRDITPSAGVLDALARVFDLDPARRGHLFDLAGVAVPADSSPYPTVVPEELEVIVENLDPNPAYLLNPRSDVLAWNRSAALLLGTPTDAPDGVQNMLWWMFTEERKRGDSWDRTSRNMLARFRTEHARRFEDPAFNFLIGALLEASPRFRDLWRRHEVLDAQLGTKRIVEHPLGPLTIHHLQSIPTSHRPLRLTQFVPADDRTRNAFERTFAEAD